MKLVKNKLKVVHFPQVPNANSFEVEVTNEREAHLVQQTLADQHLFLFKNKFIPDYTNAIGVLMYCEKEGDWVDYLNEDLEWEEFVQVNFKYATTGKIN